MPCISQSISSGWPTFLLSSLPWGLRKRTNFFGLTSVMLLFGFLSILFILASAILYFKATRVNNQIRSDRSLFFLGGKFRRLQSVSGNWKDEPMRAFPHADSFSVKWTNLIRKLSGQSIYSKRVLLLLLFWLISISATLAVQGALWKVRNVPLVSESKLFHSLSQFEDYFTRKLEIQAKVCVCVCVCVLLIIVDLLFLKILNVLSSL